MIREDYAVAKSTHGDTYLLMWAGEENWQAISVNTDGDKVFHEICPSPLGIVGWDLIEPFCPMRYSFTPCANCQSWCIDDYLCAKCRENHGH